MPQLFWWNAMIGLTDMICEHCALTCYWQTLNHWPRCQFFYECKQNVMLAQIFHFRCKYFFYKNTNAKCPYDAHVFFQRCDFHDADVPCRRCGCKVYPWWCQRTYLIMMQMSPCRDRDANVLRCKCLSTGMSWCRYPLVGMSWCEWLFVGMQWHECFDANTLYSKIPFIFKMRLPQRLKSKYSQSLIYYSWKVIFFLT